MKRERMLVSARVFSRFQLSRMLNSHSGADAYEQKAKERDLAHLRKKAAKLGYTLTATA